jgi:hypothetical protein
VTNLYALCRLEGQLVVKRVKITQPVQLKIEGIFQTQAAIFLDGVSEEIEFGGDWKPDSDEVLVMDIPQEANVIAAALDSNPVSLPTVDAVNFQAESIKALFTAFQNGHRRIFIQLFTAQQILARRFSLVLDKDTFKELTEPAFTLDNSIVAIIENGKLKFKSFFNMKKIFRLNEFYQEATDQQVDAFCGHDSIHVHDPVSFKVVADQNMRKLIHAVSKTNVLDTYQVEDIAAKAKSLGLQIRVENDKIVIPPDRKSVKQILRFLDDGIYEASLSAKRYVTNSKRLLSP